MILIIILGIVCLLCIIYFIIDFLYKRQRKRILTEWLMSMNITFHAFLLYKQNSLPKEEYLHNYAEKYQFEDIFNCEISVMYKDKYNRNFNIYLKDNLILNNIKKAFNDGKLEGYLEITRKTFKMIMDEIDK